MPVALELTVKQSRFVHEYLVDGNGTQAAIRAGYGAAGARVTACRLLTNPNVQKAVEARQASDAARLGIDRQNVLAGLLEAVDMARTQMNPAAMVAALREIGKLMGFYAPEVKEVKLSATQEATQKDFAAMTDAQLLALIERAGDSALGL